MNIVQKKHMLTFKDIPLHSQIVRPHKNHFTPILLLQQISWAKNNNIALGYTYAKEKHNPTIFPNSIYINFIILFYFL